MLSWVFVQIVLRGRDTACEIRMEWRCGYERSVVSCRASYRSWKTRQLGSERRPWLGECFLAFVEEAVQGNIRSVLDIAEQLPVVWRADFMPGVGITIIQL